jgi:predicted unusual protein kinase regulating ubiquinone biosynthesis (AarF/ABC1/UbiB family)
VLNSPELIMKSAKQVMGMEPRQRFEKEDEIYAELSRICDEYAGAPNTEISIGRFMMACIAVYLRHGLAFPWQVVLFVRTALSLDGIILRLMPGYVFDEGMAPHFLRIYARAVLRELAAMGTVVRGFDDFWDEARRSPEALRALLERLRAYADEFG